METSIVKTVANRGLTGGRARPSMAYLSRIDWLCAFGLTFYHLVALLAVLPWLFSWIGVALVVLGIYLFGTLGINLCFHRLLTHRGAKCPRWLEHTLVVLAVCCVQGTPARWVAVHRRHHEHSDDPHDPHSPLFGFLWSHIGWLLLRNEEFTRLGIHERYAKDILRDPFYARLESGAFSAFVILLSWAVFFLGGLVSDLLAGGSVPQALRFGVSILVWGVFVRTVVVWHITWSVNSVTHLWGYRNYATNDASRNNVIVALLSTGEGWHNNHHADPRSARHGHAWWEVDVTYLTIGLLVRLGLARKIIMPRAASARIQCR
jgi:fatty-acid desaturase